MHNRPMDPMGNIIPSKSPDCEDPRPIVLVCHLKPPGIPHLKVRGARNL